VCALDNFYPVGDEVVLIYEATGVVVPPGTLPVASGFGVLNVETVYNIHHALEGRPVTHKWVCVDGKVDRYPLGTRIADLTTAGTDTQTVWVGGPMMGRPAGPDETISKTTKAVFTGARGVSSPSPTVLMNRVASACCQCRTCTDLCPRHLLGYPVAPHRVMRALAARQPADPAFGGIMYCSGCGVCEKIACPQGLAPRTLMQTVKAELAKAGVKASPCTASAVSEARAYRKVDSERLRIRLGWD